MAERHQHLTTFAVVALIVVIGDLVTKQIALAALADGSVPVESLGDRIRLVLQSNHGAAFGISLGPHTWVINVALTLIALAIVAPVCPALARIDGHAPHMLGLVAGAAGGNLVSLLTPPYGVPDFIAIEHRGGQELVFNLADVAAYMGLLLSIRVAVLLVKRLRDGRRPVAPLPYDAR